jgi:RimJ/RimL family protein N-acetyltransferase
MHVERCADAAGFLAATLAYRAGEPLRTNVHGTVAAASAARTQACFWWVVRDAGGAVVGAAIRTPPHVLNLGPMPEAAAASLAGEIAAVDDGFPAIVGFGSVPDAFLAAYATTGSRGARRTATTAQRQVLYEAAAVTVPEVAGEPRVATLGELDDVARWYGDFNQEIDGTRHAPNDDDRALLRASVAAGRVRWWWRDGGAVSLAGHAEPVETPSGRVARVGPVFTPRPARGRGYAGALTGRVTQLLLASGARVILFADADNPTSNGVYRRLGYEPLDTLRRVALAP